MKVHEYLHRRSKYRRRTCSPRIQSVKSYRKKRNLSWESFLAADDAEECGQAHKKTGMLTKIATMYVFDFSQESIHSEKAVVGNIICITYILILSH